MTPEQSKILDLTYKIGLIPFMFYILFLNRADLETQRQDIKDVQEALNDCYQSQITNSKNASRVFDVKNECDSVFVFRNRFAVLPTEQKFKRINEG